jgi:hypothetical protein
MWVSMYYMCGYLGLLRTHTLLTMFTETSLIHNMFLILINGIMNITNAKYYYNSCYSLFACACLTANP